VIPTPPSTGTSGGAGLAAPLADPLGNTPTEPDGTAEASAAEGVPTGRGASAPAPLPLPVALAFAPATAPAPATPRSGAAPAPLLSREHPTSNATASNDILIGQSYQLSAPGLRLSAWCASLAPRPQRSWRPERPATPALPRSPFFLGASAAILSCIMPTNARSALRAGSLPLALACLLSACSSSDAAPTPEPQAPAQPAACAGAVTCTVFPPTATEEEIQDAFATAKDGAALVFSEGKYSFTNALVLNASHAVVIGAGSGKTTLDFSGQITGSEGLFAQQVSDLRFEGFTVRDTKGNAIKVLGITGVIFRDLVTEWTGENPTLHGPYGIYPVSSKDILIEGCTANGASDSGIYVGQSENVVVRRNQAIGNVAGIEIENTFSADVYENDSHDNTAGVLVFDLPGLPQKGGHGIRIHDNKIHDNNTDNFAPKGNIVGKVPAGTGFFVMANHDVEVSGNTIDGNRTVAVGIISYFASGETSTDATYYPYPARINVHDNTITNCGTMVDVKNQIGILLLTGISKFPGGVPSDVLYDGVVDDKLPAGANPMEICVHQGSFGNMHLDKIDLDHPDLGAAMSLDAAPYDCTLPSVPAVELAAAR
jgi:parallel beta-helix repeat protein